MIRREITYLQTAVQFLTCLPVRTRGDFQSHWIDASAKYFPLVGLGLGVLAAVLLLVVSAVFPEPTPAVVTVAMLVLLTGALHEDGVADTADGLFGGRDPAHRAAIMKDSRIGTFGVLALLAVLGFKVAALLGLDPGSAARVLVVAPAVARLAPLVMVRFLPYAGDEAAAKVRLTAQAADPLALVFAIAIAAIAGLVLLRLETFLIATLAAAFALTAFVVLCRRRIGGHTGDTLGAGVAICETVFLLFAAAVISGPG